MYLRSATHKIFFFLSALLFANFSNANWGASPAPDGVGSYEGTQEGYWPRLNYRELPGEKIDMYSRSLQFEFTDILVPGNNGMDLVLSRRYDTSGRLAGAPTHYQSLPFNWRIASVGIVSKVFNSNSSGVHSLGSCIGRFDELHIALPNGSSLMPVGYQSSNELPSGTLAAFQSGEVLVCSSNYPQILSPDGKKLTFGKVFGTSYLITKIEDRFGNSIVYEYDSSNRLLAMTRNDGSEILFRWNGQILVQAAANNRIVKYETGTSPDVEYYWSIPNGTSSSHSAAEFIVTNPEGKKTRFRHVQKDVLGGMTRPLDTLVEVIYPTGVSAWYDYTESRHNQFSRRQSYDVPYYFNETIIKRVITEVDGSQRITNIGPSVAVPMERGQHPRTAVNSVVAFDENLNAEVEHRYEFFDTTVDKTHLETGWARLNGTLVDYRVYVDGQLKFHQESDYIRQTPGSAGCVKGVGFRLMNHALTCTRPLLESRKLSLYEEGGKTIYATDYLEYDDYGRLLKQKSTGNDTIYEQIVYTTDKNNWLLALQTQLNVSENGTNWKNVSKTTYYNPTHSYKSLPYQSYEYGRLRQTITSYHSSGEAKRIDFNESNNYVELHNYRNGQWQEQIRPNATSSSQQDKQYRTIDYFGNVSEIIDFEGNKTNFTHDRLNRLRTVNFADSYWQDVSIDYVPLTNADLNLPRVRNVDEKEVVNRGNYRKTAYFDEYGNPILIAEQDLSDSSTLRYTRFEYNHNNRVNFVSYPSQTASSGHGQLYKYDAMNRLLSVTDTTNSSITQYSYLANNRVRLTDGNGNVTTTSYRFYGVPVLVWPTTINSPEGVSTSITYDIYNNVKSVSQGGTTEHRVYDDYANLCKVVRPDTGNQAYSYDAQGNTNWSAHGTSVSSNTTSCDYSVSGNEKVTYLYNNRGNLRKVTFGDGTQSKLYSYDKNENALSISAGNVVNSFSYNSINLLEQERLSIDGKTFRFKHLYDSLGNEKSLKYPTGLVVEYSPNALGQPTRANSYATNAKYHPNGELKSFTFGNGFSYTSTQYDNGSPKTYRSVRNGTYAQNHYLEFDFNGNLEVLRDYQNRLYDLKLEYDGMDRLKDILDSYQGTGLLSYDTMGNIETYKVGNSTISYSYRADKKLGNTSGAVNRSFDYDSRGNVKSNGSRTFDYNLAGNMTRSTNILRSMDFVYDGFDRRAKKIVGNEVDYFVYGNNGQLLHSVRPNVSVSNQIYLGDRLIAEDIPDRPSPPTLNVDLHCSGFNICRTASLNINSVQDASEYRYYYEEVMSTGDPNPPILMSVMSSNLVQPTSQPLSIGQEGGAIVFYVGADTKRVLDIGNGTFMLSVKACNELGCSGASNLEQVTFTGH